MNQEERRLFLINCLLNENEELANLEIPSDALKQKELLRALLNIREPKKTSDVFIKVQNDYLQEEIKSKGIVDVNDWDETEDNLYLWQGDITLLKVDAIVNAANNRMRGCFIPNHKCIDNAVHTYAGVQLRCYCDEIMQDNLEDTGLARITPAYNLPCLYVIHTVGPIIYDVVDDIKVKQLKSCYIECLKEAVKHNLDSIAFCCISTGEFRFPKDLAAEIALKTVRVFLKENNCKLKVVFNVFTDEDKKIYDALFKERRNNNE